MIKFLQNIILILFCAALNRSVNWARYLQILDEVKNKKESFIEKYTGKW